MEYAALWDALALVGLGGLVGVIVSIVLALVWEGEWP